MANAREQLIAAGAERLKQAAAEQNVYMSLARAARITAPVLDAVTPLLLSQQSIERARAAEGESDMPATLLAPADEIVLRQERFAAAVARIKQAAVLHDLSDVSLHSLPEELRTVMAAYADCQLHLRKAAALLEGLAAQQSPRAAQQERRVERWVITPPADEALQIAAPQAEAVD